MPDRFEDFVHQRPESHPMIYAYEDTNPQYKGMLKVGYTAIDVDKRQRSLSNRAAGVRHVPGRHFFHRS